MRTHIILLTVVAVPYAAQAADTPDTIVVTANRAEQPLSRVGNQVTLLDTPAIVARQTQFTTDLLRTTPGVQVTRNGGPGGIAAVFIRGAESDQTVALIDGVKLNNPASPGGGFDFGNLLTGNIARIEVLRGPSTVLWGSQAIGGVVNIVTTLPTDALTANARAEGGSFGTAQAVGNVSGKAGPVSASLGAGYFRSDGISAFAAKRGGREADGYRNAGANARLGIALTDTVALDLRGYYSDARADIDGFAPPTYAFGDTREYSKVKDLVGYAGVNAALFDGKLKNRVGFAYTNIRRRNFDPQGFTFETFASRGTNERLEYQGVATPIDAVQATFGVERETSRYRSASFGGPTATARARLDSIYGQVAVTPLPGLTGTAGVRHDDHDRFGGATTFGASGVWTPGQGSTTLRASYSEGFKAPTLYQLQGDYGNQRLQPERARGWDAGVAQRLADGRIEAGATFYHRTSRDLIDFVSCFPSTTGICTGRPFGTYDNVARTRAQGVELAVAVRPVEALTVQANYTYLDAENRATASANFGKRLPRRARDTVNVVADYRWPFGLATGATLSHVGATFDDAANRNRVAGYVTADLRASFAVGAHIEVYGRVENVLDARYETLFRYGTPGRAGYAGVRLRY